MDKPTGYLKYPEHSERLRNVLNQCAAEVRSLDAMGLLPPRWQPILKPQHVDGWDLKDGLPVIPVIRVKKNGIPYYEPLTTFLPEYKGSWQEATIDAVFGRENLWICSGRETWSDWLLLKETERMEQSRLDEHLGVPMSAETVHKAESQIERNRQYLQRSHKRTFSTVEVEEQHIVKRSRHSGSACRNSGGPDSPVTHLVNDQYPYNPGAEERRDQRFHEGFFRGTPWHTLDDYITDGLGEPLVHGKQPWPANSTLTKHIFQHNQKAAYMKANGEEAEVIAPECWLRASPKITLPPQKGVEGAGATESCREERVHGLKGISDKPTCWNSRGLMANTANPTADTLPWPSGCHFHGCTDTWINCSEHCPGSEPGRAKWQTLFAPEALPSLFPSILTMRHEPLYLEPPTVTTASHPSRDVGRGLYIENTSVEMQPGTTLTTNPMTKSLGALIADKTGQSEPDTTTPLSSTQQWRSSSASLVQEANAEHQNINLDGLLLLPDQRGQAMASEDHTAVPHERADEDMFGAPPNPISDECLEKLQRIEDAGYAVETIYRELDLTPERLSEEISKLMEGLWREGKCLTSCTGQCGCVEHWNPHIISNSDLPVEEEIYHPIRTPSPVPLAVTNRHQQQAIFPNPAAPEAHEEARGLAPPVVDVPGDNEESMDIMEIFDVDRYEQDNEESNLDWTRRV